MGELTSWTSSVPSLAILVSAVLVFITRTNRQNHRGGSTLYSRLSTRGRTLNRVQNHAGHSIASLHSVTLWPFDLIGLLILVGEVSWWTIHVASLVIVFSAVLVLSCGQTDKRINRITDDAKRFTPATVVGVSKDSLNFISENSSTKGGKDGF